MLKSVGNTGCDNVKFVNGRIDRVGIAMTCSLLTSVCCCCQSGYDILPSRCKGNK